MGKRASFRLGSAVWAVAIGICAVVPGPALADETGEAIVVTGSRLVGLKDENSTAPVTVLSPDELVAASPSTLAEALRVLPFVIPGGGPAAGGGIVGGQNFLNLRGLGNDRTLVLVNGFRFIPSGANSLTDINLIPEGLVSGVEIVTGGASAAYGSDAVAGVVNFKLDTRFEGVKLHGYRGISQRGDNAEVKLQATAGFAALDDRLHVVLSADHFRNDGVTGDARAFRRKAQGQIRNPSGSPALVHAQDLRTPYTPGGLVVTGAGGSAANNALISGLMFGAGGGTSPYDYGAFSTTRLTTNGTQDGGDGFRASTGQDIIRPLRRDVLFGHATLAVTDRLTLEAEATWGKDKAVFANSPNLATLTIQRTNPFLAAAAPALVGRMTELAVPRFSLNRLILERGPTVSTIGYEAHRELVGARLDLFGLDWSAFYQQSRNVNRARVDNNLITANLSRAVNAAIDPASGAPVCADLLSADPAVRANAAGCVAFNPFGAGAPSQAALDYVTGTSSSRGVTTMKVFDATVTGTVPFLRAMPIAFAAGYSWRRQTAEIVADPRAIAGGWRVNNQPNFFGRYSISEVFGEMQVPLLQDTSFAKSLDINLAGRRTRYSTSGGVNTWKAGVNWAVNDWLRLRGTRSRDIRAPNLDELFASGRQTNIAITDSLTNQSYNAVPVKTFGNLDLRPEVADTWVLGAVLTPSRALTVSADYWSIGIEGAIRTLSANLVVDQCNLSGQTSPICSFVTRDPVTRAIIGARSSPVNLSQQKSRGIDMQLTWDLLPEAEKDDDALTLRVLTTYTINNRVASPLVTNPVDDAGNIVAQGAPSGTSISSIPRLRANASVDISRGLFGAYLQARYIHKFTWDKTKVLGVDTDFNRVPAQVYFDAELRFHPAVADQDIELYLNVQNLLDHDPPYSPIPGNSTPLPSQPVLYDQIGRMFRVGIRAQL